MKDNTKPVNKDIITVGPEVGPGERPFVRCDAENTVTAGILKTYGPDDKIPADQEVLTLKHCGGPVYEVTGTHKGPPKVTTQAYRNGWDGIFGKKQPVGQALSQSHKLRILLQKAVATQPPAAVTQVTSTE